MQHRKWRARSARHFLHVTEAVPGVLPRSRAKPAKLTSAVRLRPNTMHLCNGNLPNVSQYGFDMQTALPKLRRDGHPKLRRDGPRMRTTPFKINLKFASLGLAPFNVDHTSGQRVLNFVFPTLKGRVLHVYPASVWLISSRLGRSDLLGLST